MDDRDDDLTKVENVERGLRETLFGPQKGTNPVNRRCSGYRLACPVVTGNGEHVGEDQPCEATVLVSLEGDWRTGEVWIADYEPECDHEYEDLTTGQQERMLEAAIEDSRWKAEEQMQARFDTREERDFFERDMRGE